MPADAPSPTAPPAAEKVFQFLMGAIRDGRYEDFILPGTERFQAGISQEMFDQLAAQLSPRLKAGHTTEYLTELGQCEHRVFLWKVSFREDGNEYIARLVLTVELQVAGFMLN